MHTISFTRRAAAASAVAAVAALALGCGGSGDKAGGGDAAVPLRLTLAAHDPADPVEFAEAVERVSGGSIRIDVRTWWRQDDPDYDVRTAVDVRAGKIDLGVVVARGWDALGVDALRPLLAPFLVDSLALQRRVLLSPAGARMLGGLDRDGLVGIALVPGALRHPLGIASSLRGAEDYAGETVAIVRGGVAEETFRLLGATTQTYVPGQLPEVAGAELDTSTIADNVYDRTGRALTANVTFWPRALTIVMNARAYGQLTLEQRAILRRAARVAAAVATRRLEEREREALAAICGRGELRFQHASAAQLAGLRARVGPIYDSIARTEDGRAALATIERLRGATPAPSPPACPRSTARPAATEDEFAGRWRIAFTRDELRRLAEPEQIDAIVGTWTADYHDGRFEYRQEGTGRSGRGRYELDGDVVRFVWEEGLYVEPGRVDEYRWSVYRDALRLSPVPGRQFLNVLVVKPLRRVS